MTYHLEGKSMQQGSTCRVFLCRRGVALALLLVGGLVLWPSLPLPAAAQADTTATAQTRLLENHSPNSALWRAAVFPGWGQSYNRHYLKIPLVYLGLAGFSAAALYTNNRYLLYRHAYLFTARENTDGSPVFPEYEVDYARLINDLGLPPESDLSEEEIESRRARLEPQFRAQRDNLRRNRDLYYFGFAFWYGLSVLDAFVSAQLMDFDVGEDLTVSVYPEPAASGLTATVRWGF